MFVGIKVGLTVGTLVGVIVGTMDGITVGTNVGVSVGTLILRITLFKVSAIYTLPSFVK